MTRFQIIEAKPFHCGQMSRILRYEQQRAIAQVGGGDIHRELREKYYESSFTRAWALDGRLAALAGVTGPTLSDEGIIWLCMSEAALKHPKEIIKECRQMLDDVSVLKRRIYTFVLNSDPKSTRMAVFLGFEPIKGSGGRAWSKEGRKHLIEMLETDPEFRIPIRKGYGIGLVYMPEVAA